MTNPLTASRDETSLWPGREWSHSQAWKQRVTLRYAMSVGLRHLHTEDSWLDWNYCVLSLPSNWKVGSWKVPCYMGITSSAVVYPVDGQTVLSLRCSAGGGGGAWILVWSCKLTQQVKYRDTLRRRFEIYLIEMAPRLINIHCIESAAWLITFPTYVWEVHCSNLTRVNTEMISKTGPRIFRKRSRISR
jgi:hypothetical protein